MLHSYWKPEGALVQKIHICITEVIELMMLQDIPNMGKDIQLSLWQAHGLWLFCWPCACVFVLCERMAFSSLFPCALMSMSNPAHLVISSLINVPHLLTLITHTLPIYSPCVCSPVPDCCWMFPVLFLPTSSLFSSCQPVKLYFLFVCFNLIINKKPNSSCNWVLASSLHPNPEMRLVTNHYKGRC